MDCHFQESSSLRRRQRLRCSASPPAQDLKIPLQRWESLQVSVLWPGRQRRHHLNGRFSELAHRKERTDSVQGFTAQGSLSCRGRHQGDPPGWPRGLASWIVDHQADEEPGIKPGALKKKPRRFGRST